MWLFSSVILLISIGLIQNVPLDGQCDSERLCDNNQLECRNGRCQCRTPWYTVCNSACVVARSVSYEGEECQSNENCIPNSACNQSICSCSDSFTARNGLCYKTLNRTCSASVECWSADCRNGRCVCPDGSIPDGDSFGCVPRLIKVYSRLSQAITAGELCSTSLNCITSLANCVNEGNSTQKFCKCPDGYSVASNNENCEPVESSLLSPLTTRPTTYGECGTCRDQNAFCTKAADERTCWCRQGFEKVGEQCTRITRFRPLIIFPNNDDTAIHNFDSQCDASNDQHSVSSNGVCTCSPGYRFRARDASCVPIPIETRDGILEYGVCTQITSSGAALSYPDRCPRPSNCVPSRDKHICSCGIDQFIDILNQNRCTYFVGTNASRTNGSCPTNSLRNATNGICECRPGFAVSSDNRFCELRLSNLVYNSTCVSDQSSNSFCSQFGIKALYCARGECRCSGDASFANTELTRCYAPLNQTRSGTRENCPPNADDRNNICVCRAGYRSSVDGRRCDRLTANLTAYQGVPETNALGGWTIDDCRSFFFGAIQVYSAGQCQCLSTANINDNNTGCWNNLNQDIPFEQANFCPPQSGTASRPRCECNAGFRPENNRCVRLPDRLYNRNDTTGRNFTGITDAVCVSAFGVGSEKSTRGDFCVCKLDAFPVRNNQYCHFFINRTTSNLKTEQECPLNSAVSIVANNNRVCRCKTGYRASANLETCDISSVLLVGTLEKPSGSAVNCTTYMNDDCVVKFGTQSFCQNNQCYCNRQLSYLFNGRCESLSTYVFPAEHELADHTCSTDQDCGGRANVVCGSRTGSNFKVCQCRSGYFLDPRSQTCTNQRCSPACDSSRNLECSGYQCVCRQGYYLRGGACVQITAQLTLYQTCNNSIPYTANTENLFCDRNCQRAFCTNNLKVEENRCVPLELENDRCIYRGDVCSSVDKNAFCSLTENQCVCGPSFYRYEDSCARSVNSVCSNDADCGGAMLCNQARCICNANQRTETKTDAIGRTIEYCIDNGVSRGQINVFLLTLIIFIRKFFN